MKLKGLKFGIAGLAMFAAAGSAVAEDWTPSGPIDLMIAFRAGGGADTLGRSLAEDLTAAKGWEFIPQNVAGRGGATMAAELVKKPADGMTIGVTVDVSVTYAPQIMQNAPFAVGDFDYISTLSGSQTGLIAKADRGWETLADVIEAAKSGEKISVGAMAPNLADGTYVIGKNNGVEFTSVMVQGGRGGLNGVVAGDLDVAWAAGIQAKGVASGDLVNLVSAESYALNASPDAPLLSEFNVPFTFGARFIVIAPDGIPAEAQDAIAEAIAGVLADENSKTYQFAKRAFGGTLSVQGEELEASILQKSEEDTALIAAAAE